MRIKRGMETRPASQTKVWEVFCENKFPCSKHLVFPQTSHPIQQLLATSYLYYEVLGIKIIDT